MTTVDSKARRTAHRQPNATAAPGLLLLLACMAQFMLILDDTIVNVALPSIGEELSFSARDLSWVPNAYFLTFGGFLLVGGKLADRFGARRLFLGAMAGFALTSLVCAVAQTPEVLIGGRAAQGVSAALLSPAALAILLASHPEGPARAKALAIWASLLGAGAATGLLLGGAITETIGWRWVFLINLPVAAVVLTVALRSVPVGIQEQNPGKPNLTAALLATAALLLLVFTIVETDDAGWDSARTLGSFAAVAALAAGFAVSERLATTRLIPAELLQRRAAMTANLLVLLAAGSLMAMFFFLTLQMQRVMGWGALETGAGFLPFSAGMAIAAGTAERLAARAGQRTAILGGATLAAIGLWGFSLMDPESRYASDLLPWMVLTGIGVGTAFIVAMNIATGGAGEGEGGVASALLTTGQQVGGAIGIAVMVTVATTQADELLRNGSGEIAAMSGGFSSAFEVMAATMMVAGASAFALLGVAERREPS